MSGSAHTLEPGIVVALLAAGSSRRFGGGKLGADLEGRPLIRWAADAVRETGFQTRVLVIAGSAASDFGLGREGWTVVVNPDAEAGIAGSIRTAAAAANGCERLVLGLADMPFVPAEHYRSLALATGVAFTRYSGSKNGVPAAFDRHAVERLSSLEGDKGANALDWPGATSINPPTTDALLDIDTAQDLATAQAVARSLR